MAFSYTAKAFDEYKNPIAFDIKQIQPVTDGNVKTNENGKVVEDANGNPILLHRPVIAGAFDANPVPTVAQVKYTDETNQPIELEEIAHAVTLLFSEIKPEHCDTGMEIRSVISSDRNVSLYYRDPIRGGVSQEFASVTLILADHKFDDDFAPKLVSVFDVNGEEAMENLFETKRKVASKELVPAPS